MIKRAIKKALILGLVNLLYSSQPIWAMSCDRAMADGESTAQVSSKPLVYWNPLFERLLTYKLTETQINFMQTVPDIGQYGQWIETLLKSGWTTELLHQENTHHYLFRAYQEKRISIHEFMTGMTYRSAYAEAGAEKTNSFVAINESNIDHVLDQDIVPLKTTDRAEVKRRILALEKRERVLLKVKGLRFGHYLTHFGVRGSFGSVAPIIPPHGTRVQFIYTEEKRYADFSLLSSSVRQILSDVMHGENSVQSVPVIGNENSFNMVHAFELGGRSVAVPFPGIKVHFPHEADPDKYPLTVLLHDYYHNEKVSHTSLYVRSVQIPYLLRLIQKLKGQSWKQLSYIHEDRTRTTTSIASIDHSLNFMGTQESAEELTDQEKIPWQLEYYLNNLGSPMNEHNFPLDNYDHKIDKYVVLGAIIEDMIVNAAKWQEMGFPPHWLEMFINNKANYRVKFVYNLVVSGKFAKSKL